MELMELEVLVAAEVAAVLEKEGSFVLMVKDLAAAAAAVAVKLELEVMEVLAEVQAMGFTW
jgi:hypothetical protein